RHEPRHLGSEESYYRANIRFRLAAAPQGPHGCGALCEPRILGRQLVKGGTHCGRCDGVHSDIETPPLGSRAARKTEDRRLGGIMIGMLPGSEFRIVAIDIYDASSAPFAQQ